MLTVAPPDAVEIRANATFEALMWAMARPGESRELPAPGPAPVAEALIDLECTAWSDSVELRRLIAETGAALGELAAADHLFLEQPGDDLSALAALNCGSALYPDDGATLVVAAPLDRGPLLRLRGPGVDGTLELRIALPSAFWELRETLCLYPEGFELFVVDGPRVIGIPRSTTIEVL
ncbi:phosphonate C-P lyase system protein PhnH [Devosia insulae DS-56]|uniref:Phosphonate C-P lyase system protein PhnH n=1 Tax=Devosia insulae DS-56 TaxID=1116389 RepID=A0A1E5XUX1_9HYPH|nr:phosphonate C-P lyase system protein PhnH [Devosia insulae]OEO32390.1 phosphonate C-P lyase system protein PhnH [Devosia insulae DS-56]